MKKHILIILLIIYFANSYGQKGNKYSIGIDANYLHHNLNENMESDFNYGFNLLLSQKIAKIKVSMGMGYSTFSAHWKPEVVDGFSDYLYREEYKVQYLNFPILLFFNNNLERKYNFSPFVGMIMNKAINYERIRYFLDEPPVYIKDIESARHLGATIRLGVNISKLIKRDVVISTAPFVDFKVASNIFYLNGKYKQPENGITFGLKIGIDYGL